jgi:hypothetical protein
MVAGSFNFSDVAFEVEARLVLHDIFADHKTRVVCVARLFALCHDVSLLFTEIGGE